MKDAIVGIVGGRDFNNYSLFKKALEKNSENIAMIVSGGAKGTDSLAYRYAVEKGITFVCHPPLRKEKEKMGFIRAAKRRNFRIADHCEALIAFVTPKSKGTWHTIRLAERLNKPVAIIEVNG